MARSAQRSTTRIVRIDDVARHLGRQHLEICPDTGAVIGVLNTSFRLKEVTKEKELSVNHLQHFPGPTADQVKAIKADMVGTGYTVGNRSAFAVIKVGAIEDCGDRCDLSLAVYRRPMNGIASHAEVRGLPTNNDNLEVLEALAKEASKLVFPSDKL